MKRFVMLFAAVVGLLTACVNDELRESAAADKLAGLEAQLEAVMGSSEDLKALNDALGEYDLEVNEASEAVTQHIAYLKKGVSLEEASLAALDQQKKIAAVVGSVEGTLLESASYGQDLKNLFEALHAGVTIWLGESFSVYYPVVLAQAKVEAAVAGLNMQLDEQQSYVSALVSDVAAGLRKDENPEELVALAGSVEKALEASETLVSGIASVAAEVEKEYKAAIKSMASDPVSFDGEALAELNASALTKADAAEATLSDLAVEVSQCKENLAALQDRLTLVEGAVNDLLGMIQSVTFMSQLSTDNAVAYYSMDVNNKVSDSNMPYAGKAQRTAVGEMELNYIVRPAAASTVLNANLEAVSVFGYYADRISTMSVTPSNYIDFEVTKVVATDATRGLVTVTVKPNLKEEFYFKEVGAKCALSIKNGVTDITSRFVEILPMDNSSTVYVTGITPSDKSVVIDKGQTMTLSAVVAPSNASEKSYSWKSSNEDIVKINFASGLLEAVGVGEATVTATTHGVDEWGLPLSVECKVKVNEAFRLSGPPYVEVGYEAQLFLDYPSDAIIESKVWNSSDASKLTVDENGKVTGVSHTYNTVTKEYNGVTVSCTINGVTTVNWNMKVAAVQPKKLITENLTENQSEIQLRVNESLSLASTIYPDNVPEGAYKIRYQSDQTLGWIDYDTGVISAGKNTYATSAWVTITVDNFDKEKYYISDSRVQRVVVVKVIPYYVKTITLADVEIEVGQGAVALSSKVTSDVSGKEPTNAALTWASSDESIAKVDQSGKVTPVAAGKATITATAQDGSGVSGSCTVTVTEPWKDFNVGDYVVRKNLTKEIEFYSDLTTAQSNGYVVGIVIAKTNPRATDPMLPSNCTHGIAIALGEGNGKWWSDSYHANATTVASWAAQNGYAFVTGSTYSGYTNTLALKAYIAAHSGLSSGVVDAFNSYNNNGPGLPNGTSQYYIPSEEALKDVAELSNMSWAFADKIQGAGGVRFSNAQYWTVTEKGTTMTTSVNPLTGNTAGSQKTSDYKVRYVFAF